MKMKAFTKSVVVIAFLLMGSFAMQATSPRNYLYDTKEENGKIISKVVFLNNDGLLNREIKYEFTYNEEGKVAEKKAFRWNNKNTDWEPFYLITYQYEEGSDTFSSVYAMWNKQKQNFNLNAQTMIIPVENYDDIFS